MKGLMGKLTNPAESDEIRTLATAIAGVERDLHGAVQEHYEAIGIEAPEDLPPAEERVDQFQKLVSHQMSGDLWGYFCQEQAPDGFENTDAARKHAGKGAGSEEWAETVAGWASTLREQLDVSDDVTDRELADRFTEQRFGVDIETFERSVVDYTDGRTLKMASRGPLDMDIRRIEAATEAVTAVDPEGEDRDTADEEGEA